MLTLRRRALLDRLATDTTDVQRVAILPNLRQSAGDDLQPAFGDEIVEPL